MADDEKQEKKRGARLRLYDQFGVFPDFDELFGGMARATLPRRLFSINESTRVPAVDIEDAGNALIVKVDMPGVEKKDIKLNVSEKSITVSTQRGHEEERIGKNYYAKERSSIGYYRVIGLPTKIKSNTAKAKLENGTLRVEVEKLGKLESATVKVE